MNTKQRLKNVIDKKLFVKVDAHYLPHKPRPLTFPTHVVLTLHATRQSAVTSCFSGFCSKLSGPTVLWNYWNFCKNKKVLKSLWTADVRSRCTYVWVPQKRQSCKWWTTLKHCLFSVFLWNLCPTKKMQTTGSLLRVLMNNKIILWL